MEGELEIAATGQALTFQEAILKLQQFWAAQGCLLLPPCDFEVPFAALHPEAFFRTLGSAPWRGAYLQPVRRPLDGRYGLHPYRLSRHHQFEVVLKPPAKEVQAIYLASLEALGLDLSLHDIRFAEWQWSPRSLGATGVGWHALIDGLGVTRLTYLERLADRDLEPASVEISYGVERLLMLLQGAPSAYVVSWSGEGSDGGRGRRRDEEEVSRYVFETADVEDLFLRLGALEREAGRCLAAGLARPAYELAVRCLEPVDVLQARGAVSGRERERWLDRVRERVIAAADLHMTYEAVAEEPPSSPPSSPSVVEPSSADSARRPAAAGSSNVTAPAKTARKAKRKKRPRKAPAQPTEGGEEQ